MELLLLLVVGGLAIGFFGLFINLAANVDRHPLKLRAEQPLRYRAAAALTEEQAALYRTLREALPGREILAGVTYRRFVASEGETPAEAPWHELVAEFLVCDAGFRPLAVIDTRSDDRESQRQALLEKAGLERLLLAPEELPRLAERVARFGAGYNPR